MIRVCDVDDVPIGEGRTVGVDGQRIALFHTANGWFALDARCPHRGGPLADGIVADCLVICPLHDRRFDLLTGAERSGDLAVRAHRVLVDGREVLVELAGSADRTAERVTAPVSASV